MIDPDTKPKALVSGTSQPPTQQIITPSPLSFSLPAVERNHWIQSSLAETFNAPWILAAPIDQGTQELCVGASFAQAIFLTAFPNVERIRTSVFDIVCPWVLY
jgi:hypothetical protein